MEPDPWWYKRGVIYEVHVRAFHDANDDGTGDFRGLTAKLGYLQDLGVTAVWLLPFYPSPLRDDGYDIADYCNVHPMFGTLADFRGFLREAHRRGLRVITELVLNHTSDQHRWFQRARRARPGSRWREYYVWSDTSARYQGTRVIFKDSETSNWAWDSVAQAYFWHRFYSHQPDLNFDHPPVRDEIFHVVDFWLGLGVDGLRLDAVPYLYEREGTSCENLPETHEFLRTLRQHVDEKFSNRMLLGEANQWPEEAVAYFGAGRGDECHMAFHFPLMPRLFMGLRMEDRVPIVDILELTPRIPDTAQWALFLRNHDELTLEMVTDEERDYMYRMYAQAHQARVNLGIRRRLAPLLANDRRRIELMNALLFSLPGTPVLYYGDEIGMGENIYLGDRNGVRTPMQWSADRNAGFSRANPQSLYLPINLDPDNHYEAVNVEVQQRNPSSLLWWMKRLIALHRRWRAFALGSLELLHPENRRILAFVRHHQDQSVLVVANLSRFVQPVALDLAGYRSLVPVELFGQTEFPAITEQPYPLTLGPHGFCWFSLQTRAPVAAAVAGVPAVAEKSPRLAVADRWEDILAETNQPAFESVLREYLPTRPWFGNKTKAIKAIRPQESVAVDGGVLAWLQVEYSESEPEMCLLPLAYAEGAAAEEVQRLNPPLVIARLKRASAGAEGILYDALGSPGFCRLLLELISRRGSLKGDRGELQGMHTASLRRLRAQPGPALDPVAGRTEQHNSFVVYGDRLILKLFRHPDGGVNPDLEMSRFLTARRFAHSPTLAGALDYCPEGKERMTVAMLEVFVAKSQNAWDYTLDSLGRFFERVAALPADHRSPPPCKGSVLRPIPHELPPAALDLIGTYVETARVIGRRTAELHLALKSKDGAFAPEPVTLDHQQSLFQSMRSLARQNLHLLRRQLPQLAPEVAGVAERVLRRENDIVQRFAALRARPLQALRLRIHGDYHLGQLLYTGKDFQIIDFEGETARSASVRRLKRSPLRDVAGMLQSFQYAAYVSLFKQVEQGSLKPAQVPELAPWAQCWHQWVSVVFWEAYQTTAESGSFLPPALEDVQVLLEAFLLEKAIYELGYELDTRPAWVGIPLQSIELLLAGGEGKA